MSDKKKQTDISDVFNSLVHNAIDFFEHSLLEFENAPKYSVIHFYASVELFFKARLLLEHWSLILSDPKRANYQNFLQGDFISVGLDESIERLTGISGESFDKQEQKIFSYLKNHRNRLMHFYHDEYQSRDSELLSKIAAEQCRGWYYLYRLLTVNWHSQFESHQKQINELQQFMKKQKEFLNARYENVKKYIENHQLKGITFATCPTCGFLAGQLSSEELGAGYVVCKVCEEKYIRIKVVCPDCNSTVLLDETKRCSKCSKVFNFIDILFATSEEIDSENHENGDFDKTRVAYCEHCHITDFPSIMRMSDEEWFCASCFQTFKYYEVKRCGWCGDNVTGETGDHYSPGCFMCAKHIEDETIV